MASIGKFEQMRSEPTNVRFSDLMKVRRVFGKPRQTGTNHAIFKTPWPADPRVNIRDTRARRGVSGAASPADHRQVEGDRA
jgi:hypothetical protein